MNDLDKAIAAAREALAMTGDYADPPGYALRDLLAALDAARGESIGSVVVETLSGIAGPYTSTRAELLTSAGIPHGTKLFAAPPAALAGHWEACARELDAIGDRGTEPPAALAVPSDTQGDEFGRGWNACRAAMQAQQPAAAVPEGYALVPVEPTTAMKCRAVEAWEGPAVYKSMFARGLADLEDKAAECWAAMLAAAERGGEA